MIKLAIPDKYKFFWEAGEEVIVYETKSKREKEVEYFYAKCNEQEKEEFFSLIFAKNDFILEKFIKKLFKYGEEYSKLFGFNNFEVKDSNHELFMGEKEQRVIDIAIFASIALIPFYSEKNGNIEQKYVSIFWNLLEKEFNNNIVQKIEKILLMRYSSGDTRFWNLAEIYGITKEKWLLNTLNVILNRQLLKFEIGKSFGIYLQVIARDSYNYATQKKFSQTFSVGPTNKLVPSPEGFLNVEMMTEKISTFLSENPHVIDITIGEEYCEAARNIVVVTLDYHFGVSSDILFRFGQDGNYIAVLRKIVVELLICNNFFLLADLVKKGKCSKREGKTKKFMIVHHQDELLSSHVTNFFRFIFENTQGYEYEPLKKELERFIKLLLE